MATTTFYISHWLKERDTIEYVGTEIEYPDMYDEFVSSEGCKLVALADALRPYGIYKIHEGHWREKAYFSMNPQESWLGSRIIEINQVWNVSYDFKDHQHRIVSLDEFVQIVKEKIDR